MNAVAENVVFLDDDVANVYAYAKLYSLLSGHLSIATCHTTLNFYGTTRRVHSARELNQNSVTGSLNNAS